MRSSVRSSFRRWRLVYLWDLLHELVNRDIKVQYKRSVLGIAWSLVTPLMQLLVFYFIFNLVLSLNIPRYSSFAFSGMLVWTWFQTSLMRGAGAITNNRELIRRPGFPAAILPAVAVMTNLINFLMSLPILVFFLLTGDVDLQPTILLLPLLMVLQFFLTLSLTFLVAAINVTFRDTQHILGVLLQLLFYLTPVFYDVSSIPEAYRSLYRLNPMASLVEAYRDVILRGVVPESLPMLALCALAGILLCIGYGIFRRVSYRFVEEL